jgi:hypothetical protein
MPDNFTLPRLSRAAAVLPASVNEEDRTVEMVFTTGTRVSRYDWDIGAYDEELVVSPEAVRMDRLNNGAPLLADHASWDIENVHGVIERGWIENGEGKVKTRFARDEDSETLWQKVKDGIIRNVSVGYDVHVFQEIIEQGRRILRAIDWEPLEVSLVAVPADARAGIRSDTKRKPCVILRANQSNKQGAQRMSIEPEVKEGEGTPAPEAPTTSEPEAPAQQPAPAQAEVVAQEARALEVMELCQIAGLKLERAAELVRSGKPVKEIRSLILAERASASPAPEIASQVKPPVGQQAGGTAARMAARFPTKQKN